MLATQSDATTGTAHGYFDANGTGTAGENEMLRQPLVCSAGAFAARLRRGSRFFGMKGPAVRTAQIFVGDYTQVGCGIHVSGNLFTFIQHFRR